MHELPVTEKILDIALKHAQLNEATKIYSITLKVGGLTDLEDAWLQHYFDYLSKDTMAAGAKLIIMREDITLRCSACNTIMTTTKAQLEEQSCPHCKATQGFTMLSGKEFFIEEMVAQ